MQRTEQPANNRNRNPKAGDGHPSPTPRGKRQTPFVEAEGRSEKAEASVSVITEINPVWVMYGMKMRGLNDRKKRPETGDRDRKVKVKKTE